MDFHDSGQTSPGAAASEADADFDPLIAALTRPIAALETRYRAAGRAVTDIIQDLSRLSARPRGRDVSPDPHTPPPAEPLEERPPLGRLQMSFDGDAILLDFQAAIAAIPDVRSVTALGERGNHVTLLVELGSSSNEAGSGATPPTGDPEQPTVVCTVCGRVLALGGRDVSDGLCAECTAQFMKFES